MVILIGLLVTVLILVGIGVLVLMYKANKLKNKLEETLIDGVRELIVEQTPEAVKYVTKKIEKK
jgi:multisubunit Na+/H+ antiporter MnhC subunit